MWLVFFLATSWTILLFIQSSIFAMVHFNFVMVGTWTILHSLLSLITSPADAVGGGAGRFPRGSESLKGRPWCLTDQPYFLSFAAKMEGSSCARSCYSGERSPLPFFLHHDGLCLQSTSPKKPSLHQAAPCQIFGLSNEKSKKDKLLVNIVFSLPQKLYPILLSILQAPSLCPHPRSAPNSWPGFLLCIVLCSSQTTKHCFSNCRLWHETNPAYYNQNPICNGKKRTA